VEENLSLPVLAAVLPSEPRKNLIVTPCRDCCFAVYEGDTQTSCRFGRIEKYRKQGVEVKECYDETKEFFVIETACLLHRARKSPWAMRFPGRDRVAQARKEVQVLLDVVVVMEEGHAFEQVRTTVESLLAQEMLPLKVTVAVNCDGVNLTPIRNLLPGNWFVSDIRERRADGSRVSKERCIDNVVYASKANFYSIFSPGFVVPRDFVSSLDRAVNDELERFVLLEPTSQGQGMTVHVKAHSYYGGNTPAEVVEGSEAGERADSVVEKIKNRIREENLPHLIKRVEEVCPAMARE
jgi:hypothetical protein